ncbi:pyridoxamine 5'-phosphate oxidase family protein [Rhizobium sp. XQZ8]|uniref:pyridoxamine 5'-phosphate oxidase family protein n=1 Tax=Rhizobium populisoli TaxID=2859785 RepID=UPI001CA4A8C1|nr:pyridoxamine 5'-phosphate oxidase family protein [Rhizobium populisoli]MBW6425608.1 pyridoxamine 5'-phosphate oxidase family protein [Rhizobium populisoli]
MFVDILTDDDRIDRDPRCRAAFDRTWQALEAGATAGSPFNFLQVATINQRMQPEVRTIVLRRAYRNDGAIYYVTDVRSPKMDDILRHSSHVALAGYDATSRVQIRMTGIANTVGDHSELAEHWSKLSEATRRTFHQPFSPGARMHSDGRLYDDNEKDDRSPFERFCPVRVELLTLEHLDISGAEHVRFCFMRSDRGWLGTRRAP